METKTIYKYDWGGYYIGVLILDDTDKSPSGRWNIPAYCSEQKPPENKDGFKIKFTDEGWIYEEISKEPEPPEPTFEELKAAKMAEVDVWTESKITGGFISECTGNPVRYDSDKDTQLTMQGIALNVNTERFANEYPLGCPVRGYKEGETEKTIQYLNAAQVYAWCADLSSHIGAYKQQGWIKQAQVEAALSKEDLDAIILD